MKQVVHIAKWAIHIVKLSFQITGFSSTYMLRNFEWLSPTIWVSLTLKQTTMRSTSLQLGAPLHISDAEQRFRASRPGAFAFLFESCCIIDTQPPLPPGTGG